MLIIGGLGRGFDPQRYLTWIHIGCFTARLRLPKNDKHRCSVGRAHDSYCAFIFFFFCLPFVYPHILHAGKFLASLDKVGSRCVPERGCLVTEVLFCLECLEDESATETTL